MKRLFYLFSVLWCGLFCAVSYAATVEGLYEAEIEALNQSDSERTRLLPAAFREVLVKVTGGYQLAEEVESELLPTADRFVRQFRFRENPEWTAYQEKLQSEREVPSWQPVESIELVETVASESPVMEEETVPSPYLLIVQFDQQMVGRALTDLMIPIWGKERPALLLWLVLDEFGSRSVVGGEQMVSLQSQITQQARQRGIPLWIPMYDLQDRSVVTVSDLWGNFVEPVTAASERYQADVVVVGRIQQHIGRGWQFRWDIYDEVGQSNFVTMSAELEEGLESGLNLLIDQQALRYIQDVNSTKLGEVTLHLIGVNSLVTFASINEYLQGLESVKSVQLHQLSEGGMLVELQVFGGEAKLRQLLGLGKQLQPVMGDMHQESEVLMYRVQP